MTKEVLQEKLKSLGITTKNFYIKSSFVNDNEVYVGLFKSELEEDFYFYNNYDKNIWKLPKQEDIGEFVQELFQGKMKYLVPMSKSMLIWENKPFEELPDEQFSRITIRQYACIHLKTPNSGTPWLDTLIKESNPASRVPRTDDTGPM